MVILMETVNGDNIGMLENENIFCLYAFQMSIYRNKIRFLA